MTESRTREDESVRPAPAPAHALDALERAMCGGFAAHPLMKIGGIVTILFLCPPLFARAMPVRPRLDFGEPVFRDVVRKSLPVIFGLAPVQLNEMVGSLIADSTRLGPV